VSPDLRGRVLADRYRVLGPLGEGAMGQVWRARQLLLDRDVALKVLHAQGPVPARARRRLHREARLVARISHPHVVQVHDFGQTGEGDPFLVMELVDGCVASERMGRAASSSEVVDAARGVLLALEAAHARGVLHRDLKPANMMLRGDDPAALVLLDFGIAAILNDPAATDAASSGPGAGGSRLTREGAVVGTPLYMAPEQARGLRTTERSDLYAAGVVLYEWLSGRPPFVGPAERVMRAHVFDRPRPLVPREGLRVSDAVVEVVGRALAKDPEERFASAAEMRRALEAAHTAGARGGGMHAPAPATAHDTLDLTRAPATRGGAGLGSLGKPPFVARARSLAWLGDGLRTALAGRGGVFLIEGEEGVGKSRLVEEALLRLDGSLQPLLGQAALTPAGGAPLHLVRAALADALGLRGLGGDAVGRRLEGLLGDDGAALASWLGGAAAAPGSVDAAASSPREADLADRAIRTLAARRSLVLVLDDLQWADPATVAFLIRQAGALRHEALPLAIVAVRQPPGERDPLADLARYHGVSAHPRTLERLSVSETEALLRSMAPLDGPSASALASRAHGSPLFAVQLLRSVQERGQLGLDGGTLRLREGVDAAALPASLGQILAGRLDRARSRAGEAIDPLLHAAAVLGEGFDVAALEEVLAAVGSPLGALDLDDALDALVQARVFVEPADPGVDRLQWEHPLLRAAVLEKVRRSRRQRRLCAAAAAALLGSTDPSMRAIVELLLLAGDRAAAAPLAATAGAQAISAGEFPQAIRLFEVGTGAADGPDRWRAWYGLGTARNHLGQADLAEVAFEAAADAATSSLERGRARFAVGRCRYNRGEHEAAVDALREAYAVLCPLEGPDAAMATSLLIRTWAAAAAALPGAAVPDVDVDALIGDASGPAERVEHRKTAGYLRLQRGDLDGSIAAFREALDDARALGHRPGLADLLCDLGRACRRNGDLSGARRYLEEALGLAQGAGQLRTEAEVHNELGELARAAGDLEGAEEDYAAAMSIWQGQDSPSALLAGLNRALVAVAGGRFQAARTVLVGLKAAHQELPGWCLGPFLLTTALAASGLGNEAAARAALEQACQGALAPGDPEGLSVLAQLRALASRGGQEALVADIDAALAALGG
jgi:tetratricopeptide (TPR) repeat protein